MLIVWVKTDKESVVMCELPYGKHAHMSVLCFLYIELMHVASRKNDISQILGHPPF